MSRNSLYRKGQIVIVNTQGLNIPGHDARRWSTARGKIVQVNSGIAQYSYNIELITGAPGVLVPFVSAYSIDPTA